MRVRVTRQVFLEEVALELTLGGCTDGDGGGCAVRATARSKVERSE